MNYPQDIKEPYTKSIDTDENVLEVYWLILRRANNLRGLVSSSKNYNTGAFYKRELIDEKNFMEKEVQLLIDSLERSKRVLKDRNIFHLFLNITVLEIINAGSNYDIPFTEEQFSDEYYTKLADLINLLYRCEKKQKTQEAYLEVNKILHNISDAYLLELNKYYDRELIFYESFNYKGFPYYILDHDDNGVALFL